MIIHPVLNYFAEDYDLKPINIELEGDEPSAADMRRPVEAGRERGISAVLVQPQFAQKSASSIAEQLGVPGEEVDPLATDWDQNMLTIGEVLVSSFETSRWGRRPPGSRWNFAGLAPGMAGHPSSAMSTCGLRQASSAVSSLPTAAANRHCSSSHHQ